MDARASLAVALVDGRTRCTAIRSDPPLTLRETPTGVHLVASGAGPVGGDDLRLEVRVGPGASLDLRSVAASMVHPGPTDRPSHLTIDVEVGDDASLVWTPQPSILVRGCDHHATTRLRLGTGATVVWRDEVVVGRHDEVGGSVLQRLVVDGPDGPVLRTDVAVGPRWPGSLGPAGTGAGVRALGTVLLVGGDGARWCASLPDVVGVRWASTALGRPLPGATHAPALVTAVAETAAALRDAFDRVTATTGQGCTNGFRNAVTWSSGGGAK